MSDMAVYMINSLLSINNTLAFYELGVGQRLEMLQGKNITDIVRIRIFFNAFFQHKLTLIRKRYKMNKLLLYLPEVDSEIFILSVRNIKKGTI